MGHGVRDVEEERLVPVAADEGQGLVGVAPGQVVEGRRFLDALLVAVHPVDLAAVVGPDDPEPVVEAAAHRVQLGPEAAPPLGDVGLADHSGGVAGGLEDRRQQDLPLVDVGEVVLLVAVLGDPDRIAAGEQRGARRAAHRLRVEAREPHALVRHAVDARRLEVGGPEHPEVAVALVVGEHEDEVRPGRRLLRCRRRGVRAEAGGEEQRNAGQPFRAAGHGVPPCVAAGSREPPLHDGGGDEDPEQQRARQHPGREQHLSVAGSDDGARVIQEEGADRQPEQPPAHRAAAAQSCYSFRML